jgi:hypothetical protein
MTTDPGPLSAKFATLRCHLNTIALPSHRHAALRLLAEIEAHALPLSTRLEGVAEVVETPPPPPPPPDSRDPGVLIRTPLF